MAYILCLETTTTNCSVALFEDGGLIALQEDMGSRYSHAERLHVYIDQVCREAGIQLAKLDAVAVSRGPGSYTGLRIGVSSAKGLCFAHDLPLISTQTLKTLALQANLEDYSFIIPMLDARRMEVYSAIYNSELQDVRTTEAQVLDSNSFSGYLENGKVLFIGNGCTKFKEICTHKNAEFLENALPSAREMGTIAQQKLSELAFEDLAYFEPYYLKDFQVTVSKKAK